MAPRHSAGLSPAVRLLATSVPTARVSARVHNIIKQFRERQTAGRGRAGGWVGVSAGALAALGGSLQCHHTRDAMRRVY